MFNAYHISVKDTLVPDPTDPCGSEKPLIIRNSISGNITSPNYPFNYPDLSDCQWEIHANDGEAVTLTIIEFETELG